MLNLQEFMDRVIEAIRASDVTAYLSMIALPYQVITASGTRTFVRETDMADHFHLFCTGLRDLGFSDLRHHVFDTVMLGETLATGTYETQLFRHDEGFVAPYRSAITLRREAGVWRAVSTAHTIGHADWMERLQAMDRTRVSRSEGPPTRLSDASPRVGRGSA